MGVFKSLTLSLRNVFFFFFLMDKVTCINHKKQQSCLKVHWEYTKGTQPGEGPKTWRKTPKSKNNYLYPIQVKNSNKLLSLSPLDTLAQDHKLQMKESFNLYIEKVSLSKTTLFLTPHCPEEAKRCSLPNFLALLTHFCSFL